MRTWIAALAGLLACGTPARGPSGPTPGTEQRRVIKYSVMTVGRHAGEAETTIEPGGKRTGHFTFNDRGRGPDIRTTLVVDASGAPTSYVATGHDYLKAPVAEKLALEAGTLVWTSTSEKGSAAAGAGWFPPLSGPFDADAVMAQALMKAPGHRLKLLPSGEAWIEDDARLELSVGGKPRTLRRVAIAGLGFSPSLVWLDEQDELFGEVSPWTSVIQAGAEAAIDDMIEADEAWKSKRAAKLASALAHRPPAAGLAFVHANVFDSESKKLIPDQTVVVVGDKIVALGAKAAVPAGARVIDATGKTLLPGLFDMHVHLGDADGVLQLASGITTVRDMGNDVATLAARVERFDGGTEIGPRVLRAGLIDGPGEMAAPTGVLAGTPEEAVAAVKKFKDAGYVQIKIYSSVKPALVPVIANAAKQLGMRVSGHIPNGMNAAEAVLAGYDEIQHANFLFLRFLAGPADDTRTPVRFTKVAEGAADLDLAGKDVQAFLDLLVEHKTVLDPTLATFHGMFTADAGDLDPVLAPYAGRLPAQVERGGHGGGLPAPGDKRAKYRASHAALGRMVKAAWDRKITIVPGTDDVAGLSYSHELELYVAAGIPAAEVLALASLGAARVMHVDKDRGSISVGKQADLVLVDGDPTKDITAVRKASSVVCRGAVYDPGELFTAVGMRAP